MAGGRWQQILGCGVLGVAEPLARDKHRTSPSGISPYQELPGCRDDVHRVGFWTFGGLQLLNTVDGSCLT